LMTGRRVGSTQSLVRVAAAALCIILSCVLAASCGGKTSTSSTTKTTPIEKKSGLAVANSWAVDNQTHQEPMQDHARRGRLQHGGGRDFAPAVSGFFSSP